jgi:hypothetical protein
MLSGTLSRPGGLRTTVCAHARGRASAPRWRGGGGGCGGGGPSAGLARWRERPPELPSRRPPRPRLPEMVERAEESQRENEWVE